MPDDRLEVRMHTDPALDELESMDQLQRFNRSRWRYVGVYVGLVTVLALLPLFIDLDEALWGIIFSIVIVVGTVGLLVMVSRPYYKRMAMARPTQPMEVPEGSVRPLEPGETYFTVVRFDLILYIIVPIIVVMAIVMVLVDDTLTRVILGLTTLFMAITTVIFINLIVKADRETLSFKFGRVGKEIPLESITSISVTSVKALSDFMGYGVRVGSDGTIGYIVSGDVGFRVEVDDGKAYVVTIPEPQALVDYVLAAKAVGQD